MGLQKMMLTSYENPNALNGHKDNSNFLRKLRNEFTTAFSDTMKD
jgi:hypothetical protein